MPFDHLFQKMGTTNSSFLVEVDGVPIGSFTEVEGLEMSVEVEEYKEGGVNGFTHKLPGRTEWQNLTLKRGMTWNNFLIVWFDTRAGDDFVTSGKVSRDTMAVTMLSATGRRLRTWVLFDAMPVKWTGPSMGNEADAVPTEELEVAHHGFESITFPIL